MYYTRKQAQAKLGLSDTSRSAFHYLKTQYPGAFVIVHPSQGGRGAGSETLYDAKLIDELARLRERMKELQRPPQ